MSKTKSISMAVAVASLAGFLFGFDTIVISGANLPIKELWNHSPAFHGLFIMSMALWGTVLGAATAAWPSNKFGRKKVMLWIGVLFSLSALGSALAQDPYSFSFFRFIGGVGVGASSVVVPAYLAEISSKNKRGFIVATYQFMLVLGILIAFISNYLLDGVGGETDWRWMMGVETIPAVAFSLLVLVIPESPRWLRMKGNIAIAKEIENNFGLEAISEEEGGAEEPTKLNGSGVLSALKWPIAMAFLIAFFNQFSGINFVLYYAPEILENAGVGQKDSLANSILIGVVNLLVTIVAMVLLDRTGRKRLMLIGSLGYISSLVLVALTFQMGWDNQWMLFGMTARQRSSAASIFWSTMPAFSMS
ncbi:MAG: MFS transporter, partial [Bacteroidota bacterium]